MNKRFFVNPGHTVTLGGTVFAADQQLPSNRDYSGLVGNGMVREEIEPQEIRLTVDHLEVKPIDKPIDEADFTEKPRRSRGKNRPA